MIFLYTGKYNKIIFLKSAYVYQKDSVKYGKNASSMKISLVSR